MLERLFDIEDFAAVEAWLVEQRRSSAALVQRLEAGYDAELARLGDVLAELPGQVLAGVAGPEASADPPGRAAAGVPPHDAAGWVGTGARRLTAYAAERLAALDTADRELAVAQARSTEGFGVAAARARGEQAAGVIRELDADADRHAARVRRLDAARRSAALAGDLRALDTARSRVAETGQAVVAARAAVRAAAPSLAEAMSDEVRVSPVLARLATARPCLVEASGVTEEIVRLASQHAVLEPALKAATVRVRAAGQRVSALEDEGRALDQRLANGEPTGRLARAEHEVARLSRLQALARERAQALSRLDALRPAVHDARQAELDARETHQVLLQRRLDGMAAELASVLVDGQQCPVCGSMQHPAPSWGGVDLVSGAAVSSAEAQWQLLHEDTERLRRELAGLDLLAQARTRDLEGYGDTHAAESLLDDRRRQADDRLAEAVHDLTAYSRTRVRAREVGVQLRAAADEVAHAKAELAAAASMSEEVAARRERLSAHRDDLLAAHRGQCPCAGRAGAPSAGADIESDRGLDLPSLLRLHDRVTRALEADLVAGQRHAEAAEALAAVTAEVGAAVSGAGFSGADAARAALLGDTEMARLREVVQGTGRAHDAARAVLSEAEVQQALEAQPPDLPGLAGALDEARAAVRARQREQTVAEGGQRRFEASGAALVALADELAPAQQLAADVAGLASTVTGMSSNERRMRLTSYVLAARLERVAELANERLLVMGEGRYLLAHTDELAGGGRRSGLGLLVRDQWTGQERDTASLSGGESFMASLALALGLADAVRSESGGMHLGTLFVDEGFGSLDEESLEQVLTVLDSLRAGGRCVGVVSHVAELRARVPAQLVVTKTPTGSTVRTVGTTTAVA